MTWNDVLILVAEGLASLVVTLVIPFAFKKFSEWVDAKKEVADSEAEQNILNSIGKYISMTENLVSTSVRMVNQTFVDSLKAEGTFNAEKQKEAFEMCKENIIAGVSKTAKDAIILVYGDFDKWVKAQIESAVFENKMF